jgi:hypothetical protein
MGESRVSAEPNQRGQGPIGARPLTRLELADSALAPSVGSSISAQVVQSAMARYLKEQAQ